MTPFAPTHEIVVTRTASGLARLGLTDSTTIPVMRDGDQTAAVLYTREEWETSSAADWEVVDGELRWQGQPAGMYALGATIALTHAQPETVAEACGIAWGKEMVAEGERAADWQDTDQSATDLETCAFDALVDDLLAAGYDDPKARDDWRSLVSLCCKAAAEYVKAHGERDDETDAA